MVFGEDFFKVDFGLVGKLSEIGGEFFARVREGLVDEDEDAVVDEWFLTRGENEDLRIDFWRGREKVFGDDRSELRFGEVFDKKTERRIVEL